MKKQKLKVGIYSITGCMGCQLNILYQKELLDILNAVDLRAFPVGKEKNLENEQFDIIFLEGVVVDQKDLKELKHLRSITKKLIAIGACATDGCVPAIKNFQPRNSISPLSKGGLRGVTQHKQKSSKAIPLTTPQEEKKLKIEDSSFQIDPSPLDDHVQVDGYIRGCPMDKTEFLDFIKQTLLGKEFKVYEKPICYECNLRERGCLLEEGVECLGPVTFGNCSVMCPEENYPCVGCRGPYSETNFEAYFKLLEEKGIPKETIFAHLTRFAGVKFARMMEEKHKKSPEKSGLDMFCKIKK